MEEDLLDVSVVIPTINEGGNIAILLEDVRSVMQDLELSYEVLVVDGGSTDDTQANTERFSFASFMMQEGKGYAGALRTGFKAAKGKYIITLDADLSHNPKLFIRLWHARKSADMVIASRYVPGGSAEISIFRMLLSVILNWTYTLLLAIPYKDISSGFRLYKAEIVKSMRIESQNYEVLEEILVKIMRMGYPIKEVPFRYAIRKYGKSKVKLVQFAISFAKGFFHLLKFRYFIKINKT